MKEFIVNHTYSNGETDTWTGTVSVLHRSRFVAEAEIRGRGSFFSVIAGKYALESSYSKKFFEAHREELTLHKAAKQAFDELGVKKLPKVKELNAEYAELFAGKKAAYAEYRKLRDEAQELLIAQSNIVNFLSFYA